VPQHYEGNIRCSSTLSQSVKNIKAILFDKDGTLIDVDRTWGPATLAFLERISDGNQTVIDRLALALNFSVAKQRIDPASTLFRVDPSDYGELIAGILERPASREFSDLVDEIYIQEGIRHATFITDIEGVFKELKKMGYLIGVSTNDLQRSADNQLKELRSYLDFVAGADSGWGAKRSSGHILAFAKKCRVQASNILVVGDSSDDIQAAVSAGSVAIAVLSGPRSHEDVEYFEKNAVAILKDVSLLSKWLTNAVQDN
jgi:phosphoglycolate phosphatase